jgi:NhaA family Na+:H+ antiporter
MTALRSDRFAAVLLVLAAIAGLAIANSPVGPVAAEITAFRLGFPAIGIDLSVGHWITDGLLAIFFFLAAIELRHELREGELNSPGKALVPTIAAVGGVIVPAVLYLLIAGGKDLAQGWPIPTATDIAFALGVLAVLGRSLPPQFRAMLLALAVIDDLIAILIIATFFTTDLQPLALLAAVPVVLLFGWVSTLARRPWTIPALVLLGIGAWVLVMLSGVHPTIAGVALGLVMASRSAAPTRHALEPWSNLLILPLFALTAALVALPAVGVASLSPAFWAVLVALPVGKLIGITVGAIIAGRIGHSPGLPVADVIALAGLGGIGFTVSLLMNELAFESQPQLREEVTIAVLLASCIAVVVGGTLTAVRNRRYARLSRSS